MTDAAAGPVSDDEIREAIRRYFRLLQRDPTADDMRAEAVTDDFPTGMPSGGYQWDGPEGWRTSCVTGRVSSTSSTTSTRC